ncbi:MAG: cell division protein [Burkholderiales bacterium]|nr:cell division protein [Burkholderiales bacterium]
MAIRPLHKPRRRSSGNFLAGMGVGVLMGLLVSLAIAFYLNRTPLPFMTAKPKQAEKNGAPAKPPVIAGLPQGGAAPAPASEKPKFDFYRILPGAEEPVTEKEIRERMRAKGGAGQQDAAKDVYFIQAGSFQNPADADNQKARLAILGFYRVRLGPYARLDEINKVRQALAQNGINANLIKVKDNP